MAASEDLIAALQSAMPFVQLIADAEDGYGPNAERPPDAAIWDAVHPSYAERDAAREWLSAARVVLEHTQEPTQAVTPEQQAAYEAAVAACPEPFWHETHHYCPVCPWTERGPLR